MQNYARVGGILSIIAGGLGALGTLAGAVFMIAFFVSGWGMRYYGGYDVYWYGGEFFYGLIIAWSLIAVLLCALAIIGGIFGIKRKNWGLALAGAIAGTLIFFPCGVVAIIFTAIGKPEFSSAPVART